MRRTSLAAVAALLVSLLVWVTTTPAHAALESGTALPPGPAGMTPKRLGFVGDEVWATWAGDDGVRHLYRTAADGTGDWQVVDDPETGLPVTGVGFWDGVISSFRPDPGHTGCSIYRFASAAGVWETPGGACPSSQTIGPGGDLVRLRFGTSAAVYDAADGSVVASGASGEAAMNGTWLWAVQGGALVGHDTSGAAADRQVAVPASCQDPSGPFRVTSDAAGGLWADVVCADGLLILPLVGQGAGLRQPFGSQTSIGNGFTYASAIVGGQVGLEVRDLSAQLVSHDYGPGNGFVESDAGAPRVAWIAGGTTVRVAHLDWLGVPPTAADDTTPPTIESTDGSPPVVAVPGKTQDLTFSWTASDDLPGAMVYDVQVGGLGGDPTFKPYRSTWATTVQLTEIWGSGTVCFRVRAVDRVGNPSAWSNPRCTLLDHHRPQMQDRTSDRWDHPRILNRITGATVTDRFHASDDTGVTSYDVQQRVAPPSKGFRPWQAPRAWQGITATSVTRTIVPGAEVCFRSRAHDIAGRTSPWGDLHCYVVPQDDDVLARHGPARRRAVSGAFGGWLTRLGKTADVSLSHSYVGRSIVVRELIHDQAIGCLSVVWSGRPVKGCGGANGGKRFAWVWATSRQTREGAVFIYGDPYALTDVDAIAVVR
jgi:hypothetical protein